MTTKKFDVTGMTCSACSAAVNRAVAAVDGVESVSVSLLTNGMTVTCADDLSDSAIIDAVTHAGYRAAIAVPGRTGAKDAAEEEYQ